MSAAGLRPEAGGQPTTKMPNFLIIGAAKSGTTSLYYYLKQHPQVHMSPKKELRFFAHEGARPDFRGPNDEAANRDAVTTVEEYRKYFAGARGEKALGEASPFYLSKPEAAANIRRHVPEAKLIAVLRHPAERAYSSFMHMVRDGYEPLADFASALREEDRRVAAGWSYIWRYRRGGSTRRSWSATSSCSTRADSGFISRRTSAPTRAVSSETSSASWGWTRVSPRTSP